MAKAKKAEAEAEAEADADGEAAQRRRKASSPRSSSSWRRPGCWCSAAAGRRLFFFFKQVAHDEKPAPVAVKPPAFVDLPDVLVNLPSAGNGRTQYLKAKIVLEVADQKLVEQIKPLMPRVMDCVPDLSARDAPDRSRRLGRSLSPEEELTRRVNVAVAPTAINAVLFKEIVVQ